MYVFIFHNFIGKQSDFAYCSYAVYQILYTLYYSIFDFVEYYETNL